jgi:hypothetical protein
VLKRKNTTAKQKFKPAILGLLSVRGAVLGKPQFGLEALLERAVQLE